MVRSLGAAGHDVIVASDDGRSIAGASKFSRIDLAVTNPLESPRDFRAAMVELCRREEVDVLIPIGEAALEALLAGDRSELPCIPFPSLSSFRRAADKELVLKTAERLGIAVPKQWVVAEPSDIAEALPPGTPLVLKPSRSIRAGMKLTVTHLTSRDELPSALARFPGGAYPILLQERIEGEGAGVFLLRWNGCTRAVFAHRRIREKPPSGGVSVLRESVPLDDGIRRSSEALLEELDWNGVAMVEFKKDAKRDRLCLMEINPRFWGSLQLAIDAGVDFPRLLIEAALGLDPPPDPPRYEVGVRTRWELGDLDHLLLRLRHSRARLHLPAGARGRWRAMADFLLACLPPTRQEVFRASDPRPFVREVKRWLAQLP